MSDLQQRQVKMSELIVTQEETIARLSTTHNEQIAEVTNSFARELEAAKATSTQIKAKLILESTEHVLEYSSAWI